MNKFHDKFVKNIVSSAPSEYGEEGEIFIYMYGNL